MHRGDLAIARDASTQEQKETERLAALHRYGILDTAPEAVFGNIVRLACEQFGVPIALISLVDADRLWFKAAQGLEEAQLGRGLSYCTYAVQGEATLVVPDTLEDQRFPISQQLHQQTGVRFYAGAPLLDPHGCAIGTLCLMEYVPHTAFMPHDEALLRNLARVVMDQIEARHIADRLLQEAANATRAEQQITSTHQQMKLLFDNVPLCIAMLDRELRFVTLSAEWLRLFRTDLPSRLGRAYFDAGECLPIEDEKVYRQIIKGRHTPISTIDELPRSFRRASWVRRHVVPWRHQDGSTGGLIIVKRVVDDQMRAAQELERNQHFLEAVLHNVKDGIIACDAKGKLSLLNRAAKQMHGLGENEVAERKQLIANLYEPDGITPLAAKESPLSQALKGKGVNGMEMVIAPEQGSSHTVLAYSSAMTDRNGNKLGAVVSLHDVTSEREAEIQIEEAHARTRAIFNNTFQFCGLLDLQGNVLDANLTVLSITGKTREEVIGKPLWDIEWWREGDGNRARLEQSIQKAASGQFVRYTTEVSSPNHGLMPIDFSLKPIKDRNGSVSMIIAEGRDISEQIANEKALRESEERYRRHYHDSPVMMHSLDSEGRLLMVSEYWLEKMGYEREEVIGHPFDEFHNPKSAEYFRTQALPTLIRTGSCKNIEYELVTKSGNILDAQVSAIAIYDDDGQMKSTFSVINDITERKQVERQLIQAQKMESVGQLTGGLAHDFNNLLGVVMGNLELLRLQVGEQPEVDEHIAAAIEAVKRGSELTQRLLAFSRRQKLERRSFLPNPLLEDLSGLLRRTLGETISLDCRFADNVPKVRTDPSQLESALLNLTVNARDAMPDGGQLTIESAVRHLDQEYVRHDAEIIPGDYVMLAITDTGTGIPPDKLEHVFEPFFTTKDVGKGSGLGLSMIYGFMKQSGGHARIYSEVGHGTTVRLYFPVDTSEEADNITVKFSGEIVRGNGETILVVEDQEQMRRTATALLEKLGYTVIAAEHGPAAMPILESIRRIDLLFTDIVMPLGMDGPSLARAAQMLRPDLPVVFATGYAEEAVLGRIREFSSGSVVTKPYQLDELSTRISNALKQKQEVIAGEHGN
jgi:PAS domain S-box-containing protein